jgi:Co/Zn/Cd efflux system component
MMPLQPEPPRKTPPCLPIAPTIATAPTASADPRYRRILWIALIVNAAMFAMEMGAGMRSGSASLLADAIDFLGDAANYGRIAVVLAMALQWRARAALLKGASMLAFGLFVWPVAWGAWQGIRPRRSPWAGGPAGLAANVGVAVLLYAWREGDANMRSVWLCTRNDALGNLAVMAGRAGRVWHGPAWPDLAVAAMMAGLAISGGWSVVRQARQPAISCASGSSMPCVAASIASDRSACSASHTARNRSFLSRKW